MEHPLFSSEFRLSTPTAHLEEYFNKHSLRGQSHIEQPSLHMRDLFEGYIKNELNIDALEEDNLRDVLEAEGFLFDPENLLGEETEAMERFALAPLILMAPIVEAQVLIGERSMESAKAWFKIASAYPLEYAMTHADDYCLKGEWMAEKDYGCSESLLCPVKVVRRVLVVPEDTAFNGTADVFSSEEIVKLAGMKRKIAMSSPVSY
jgi:hypothetical protein